MKINAKDCIKSLTVGSIIGLALYQPLFKIQDNILKEKYRLVREEKELDIPNEYHYQIGNLFNEDNISHIDNYLHIDVTNDASLDWLNYTNLKLLSISLYDSDMSSISDIKYLPDLNKLTFMDFSYLDDDDYTHILTKGTIPILYDNKTITSLKLHNVYIDEELLESISNLEELEISSIMNPEVYNIDYKKLTNLKRLNISSDNVYTYSIYFTLDDYNYLTSRGVDVVFKTPELKEQFFEINNWFDNIIKECNIDDKKSGQAKVNALLEYVINHLEYDELIRTDAEYANSFVYNKTFYINGYLYGAVNKESQICGNYAAMMQGLIKRANLDSKMLISHDHSWNLVTLDGREYYLDSTWIDNQVVRDYMFHGMPLVLSSEQYMKEVGDGYPELLRWYMVDPRDYKDDSITESHTPLNIPNTELNERQMNNYHDSIDLKNKMIEYQTKEGKMKFIRPAVLLGLLMGLGLAIDITNVKKREQERLAVKNSRKNMTDDLIIREL
jgi:hypothetical protein